MSEDMAKQAGRFFVNLGCAVGRDEMIELIACMCHEMNRAYCESLGDLSQLAWDDAPDWQKESAREGVKMHLETPGLRPSESHEAWMAHKREQGWKLGPVKDEVKKEHPCMVPWNVLPEEQRLKDILFKTTVRAMSRED